MAHLAQTAGWVALVLAVSVFLGVIWALATVACQVIDQRQIAARQRILDEARRRLVLDAALRLPLRHIRPRREES